MPPKRKKPSRAARSNSKGKEVSGIKPLALEKSPRPRRDGKAVKANTPHVVTPSKNSKNDVETVEEDEGDDEEEETCIQDLLKEKRAKQTRLQVSKKIATEKVPAVAAKKVPAKPEPKPKPKKMVAVVNAQDGNAKMFKTDKLAKVYLEEMSRMGVAGSLKTFAFENQDALDAACAGCKTNDNPKRGTTNSTATASTPLAASVPANPSPQAKSAMKHARLEKKTPDSNPLAARVANKLSSINGASLKLSLFPQELCVTDQHKYQVFAIDFVENKTGSSVWTHKPDAWTNIFQADEELTEEDGGRTLDPFFHSLNSASPHSEPKGPNIKKQLETKKGKVVDCQLLWGIVKCTPDTEATLKAEIAKFSLLASDRRVQEAHHIAVQNMGTSFPQLLEQIQPPQPNQPRVSVGEHWKRLNKSCVSPIKIVQHASMDEVFQDDEISTAASFLWEAGGQSTSMWSSDMNMFAFGRA